MSKYVHFRTEAKQTVSLCSIEAVTLTGVCDTSGWGRRGGRRYAERNANSTHTGTVSNKRDAHSTHMDERQKGCTFNTHGDNERQKVCSGYHRSLALGVVAMLIQQCHLCHAATCAGSVYAPNTQVGQNYFDMSTAMPRRSDMTTSTKF